VTAIEAEARIPHESLAPKILWGVALAFALLRFYALDADPSGLLSPGFLTDEGWYSLNARNQALFGQWVQDEHNVSLVLCPLHTLALWASYAVFGVSFWSTRIVGALASALTIGLIGWRLRKQPLAGALAAALVATQPMLFSLARVAYCESFQLFFVSATWFFATDEKRRSRSWLLAGAAASLAVFAKASALYAPMLAVTAPFLWTAGETRSRRLREAGLALLGCALVVLAFVPFEARSIDLLVAESGREDSVLSFVPRGVLLPWLIGFTEFLKMRPGFWAGTFPLLALASAVGTRLLLTRPRAAACDAAARVALGWLFLSLLVLSIRGIPALPERYWMNLLVPIACLSALACSERAHDARGSGGLRSWAACALLAFGPALVIRNSVQALLPSIDPNARGPLERIWIPCLVAAALLTLVFKAGRVPERLSQASRAATALAILVVAWSCLCSTSAVWRPTFSERDTSRALASDGKPKVLMGNVANSLALETPYRAFVRRDLASAGMGTGWINGDWRALGATHCLTDGGVDQVRGSQPPIEGAVLESSFEAWPDASGQPRWLFLLWRLPEPSPRGAGQRSGSEPR
jgi:4-amino-4-deoxy-L-arabinose transferase-like glycosyltransferase